MTTPKQIQANRKNASLSTGPRTAAGKAAVSQNAVRHGLRSQRVVIEGESQAEFDDFRNSLIAEYTPADTVEMLLVDRIAAGFWRLRRTGQIEAEMFDAMRQSLVAEHAVDPSDDPRFDDVLPVDYASFPYEDLDGPEEHVEEYDPYALPDAIAVMKDRFPHVPEIYDRLSEWEQSARQTARIPFGRYSIPAYRQHLQGLSELLPTMGDVREKYQTGLKQGIELLLHLEESIKSRRKPNLGKTLCHDFKGPDSLGKFTRYESQIERSLYKAMHELQRLQAKRQNHPTILPIAVDIDISGDKIP